MELCAGYGRRGFSAYRPETLTLLKSHNTMKEESESIVNMI